MPYDLSTAVPVEPDDEAWQAGYWLANFEVATGWVTAEVTADQYRIIQEYQAALDRAAAADDAVTQRRHHPPGHEPAPEEIPPAGELLPRQEAFCRHYAAQPVATRAAALAGYAEDFAKNQGYRLLKNPLVLDRVAQLRAERGVVYALERDTLHDKLEALFFDALHERNHAAAVAALRLQARLGGILTRIAEPPDDDDREDDRRARNDDGRARKRRPKRRPMTTNDDR